MLGDIGKVAFASSTPTAIDEGQELGDDDIDTVGHVVGESLSIMDGFSIDPVGLLLLESGSEEIGCKYDGMDEIDRLGPKDGGPGFEMSPVLFSSIVEGGVVSGKLLGSEVIL